MEESILGPEPPGPPRIRQVHARPRLWCWTCDCNQINLPKGLPPGQFAIIVGHADRDWEILSGGRRWIVDLRCLKIPYEYRSRRDHWLSEFDPRVRRYLEQKLTDARARKARGIAIGRGAWSEHLTDLIIGLKDTLRRNGWEVDDLPGDGWCEG